MKVEIKNVTPEFAAILLEQNESNRKINKNQLDMLCRTIESGHWRLTHQGVAIYEDGTLADGQHRLSAIVKTGIACEMPVFYGIKKEESSIMAIDSGKQRTVVDSSAITGLKVTGNEKALINGLEFGFKRRNVKKLTHHEVLSLFKKYENEMILNLEITTGIKHTRGVSIVPVKVALIEAVGSGDFPLEFVKDFYVSLCTGEYSGKKMINAIRLRNKLMSNDYNILDGRLKAYNYTFEALEKAFDGIELKRFRKGA